MSGIRVVALVDAKTLTGPARYDWPILGEHLHSIHTQALREHRQP